jgi:hypothetical protein
MFFGKFPPRGFHERPAARFLLPSDTLTGMPAGMVRSEFPSVGGERPAPHPSGPRTPPTDLPAGDHPSTPPGGVARPEPRKPALEPLILDAPGGKERRQHPRVALFVNFTLQQVDEWGMVLQEELTVADNVSKGGAHVMTTLGFAVGDIILLQEAGGGYATRAEIRGIGKASDGIGRLHLKFLDRLAPDRLMQQR